MEYGIVMNPSANVGEEIQCLAAMRFLPKVDYLIHKESLDKFKSEHPVSAIMNAWYMFRGDHFPPSDSIHPLWVSMHLDYSIKNRKFLNDEVIRYFKQYEPIGCRDQHTCDFLCDNGIKAYFSGCLTTTLLPNQSLKHKILDDYILLVDAPDDVVDAVKKRSNKRVVSIKRYQNVCFSYPQRMKLAKFNLFLHHNASCIVTVALHAALPATAFGTPVCVIDRGDQNLRSGLLDRFSGMEGYFHIVKQRDFVNDTSIYDINHPPENPKRYIETRDKLVRTCTEFTGFDRNQSLFEDDYNPAFDIAEIMPSSDEAICNSIFFVNRKTLLKPIMKRLLLGLTRNDIDCSKKCADEDFVSIAFGNR